MIIGYFVSVCWIIFLIYWAISSRSVKETVEKSDFNVRFTQVILMFLAFLLLGFGHLVHPLEGRILPNEFWVEFLGDVICTLGLAGAIWARKTLGSNWSGTVTFKKNHELIQKGPYKYVRHPIYTSLLLMFIGTMIVIGRLGGFVGLIPIFFALYFKYRAEEKLMLKHFGHKYEEYMKKVKAIIPFVF